MKNKAKKRNIDEAGGDEMKNANEGNERIKKMKKPHQNIVTHSKTSIFKKSKKKKNFDNNEKLNTEKAHTISSQDDNKINKNELTNKKIEEKLKHLKVRQAKREKRKQFRKEHGQNRVRDTIPIEVIKQKIAEIESRENISKTAKRKLRVFKKKLLDATETSSPSETPKLLKNLKQKLEKSNSQSQNKSQIKTKESFEKCNIKNEIETSIDEKNVKTELVDSKSLIRKPFKSKNKQTLQTSQNSKIFIKSENSLEEYNSENDENVNEDDSSNESSQSIEEKESVEMDLDDDNENDEEDDTSEEDLQEKKVKELESDNNDDAESDARKKSVQKAITKQKQRKNENDKRISSQENTEKKKRYVLFVGNIPFQATVEDIKKHFLQKVKQIVSVRIPTIKGSKKPRGFAYVEVTNSVDYEKALSLHHTNLQGFKIKVEYTQTGSKNIKNKQEIVAKNKKLHALRKAGKLAGSKKKNHQRNFRRKIKKNQDSGVKDEIN